MTEQTYNNEPTNEPQTFTYGLIDPYESAKKINQESKRNDEWSVILKNIRLILRNSLFIHPVLRLDISLSFDFDNPLPIYNDFVEKGYIHKFIDDLVYCLSFDDFKSFSNFIFENLLFDDQQKVLNAFCELEPDDLGIVDNDLDLLHFKLIEYIKKNFKKEIERKKRFDRNRFFLIEYFGEHFSSSNKKADLYDLEDKYSVLLRRDFIDKYIIEVARRCEVNDFKRFFPSVYKVKDRSLKGRLFGLWIRCLKKGNDGKDEFIRRMTIIYEPLIKRYSVDFTWIDLLSNSVPYSSCANFNNYERLKDGFFPDPDSTTHRVKSLFGLSRDKCKSLARSLANIFYDLRGAYEVEDDLLIEFYEMVNKAVMALGLDLPYSYDFISNQKLGKFNAKNAWADIECFSSDKFWFRRINKAKRRGFENVMQSLGAVGIGKGKFTYISEPSFKFFLKQQAQNEQFLQESSVLLYNPQDSERLKNGVMADEKKGFKPVTQLSLYDVFESSVANPKNRVIELKCRAKGAELYADEYKYIGLFVTATIPSRFHPNSKKYDGSSVKDGMEWFTTQWGRARARFEKHGIDYYGIRCVEPHNDGTPHGHFIIFIKPEHSDKFISVMRDSFMFEPDGDKGEKWEEGRFNFKKIDKTKGSAVSYVFKYIAKNVHSDDKNNFSDENENLTLADNSLRVRAWASLWGIRQFQFFGLPSVTCYREMRRVDNKPEWLSDKALSMIEACDKGDFYQYIKLQGKADYENNKAWYARPYRVAKGVNERGDTIYRVMGVNFSSLPDSLITRGDEWIVDKAFWNGASFFKSYFDGEAEGEPKGEGEAEPSWTIDSNCNLRSKNKQFFDRFSSGDPP